MAKFFTVLFSFIVGAVVAAAIGFYTLPGMMIKEIPSPYSFQETLVKIEANAREMGWSVPSRWRINFQRNLLNVVKVDIGTNQVINICEPKSAAAILIHDELKRLTVMMPCTIAVYEKSDGITYISIMNMRGMGLMFGDVLGEITDKLAPQMEAIVTL